MWQYDHSKVGRSSSVLCLLGLVTAALSPVELSAQYADGRQPPTVIGPTGRPYGPTQAEYQYQLRYGQPSPNARPGDMRYVNGYPAGGAAYPVPVTGWGVAPVPIGPYGGWGYTAGYHYQATSVFGPGLQVGVFTPGVPVTFWQPQVNLLPNPGLLPRPNDPLEDPLFRGDLPRPVLVNPQPIIEPSTPAQQIRAIRSVDQGDRELQRVRYQSAANHYKQAIAAARDQATPRFRLGLTYVGRGMYREAIEQYRLGLALDPQWPTRAEHLSDLLGENNTLARNELLHRAALWVNEDIRDPDRLFLLVVLLHQSGDQRAQDVLKTALLLAGDQPHLLAFQQVSPAVAHTVSDADPAPADFGPAGNEPPPIPQPPAGVPPFPDDVSAVPPPPSREPGELLPGTAGPTLPQRFE
jgi:tetratricopeptide (TPR) repeat protein